MPLTAGQRLGAYEIVDALGAGGMGEVYRARDPRLGRDVAIKVSREQFGERVEREARAVAALNHPNICTIHDVGPNYLVMELVEGPTLADRVRRGPLPLSEALEIARQVSAALDAAHQKGIVHRDLKPANIKLPADGPVKVLDFGLATQTAAPAPQIDPESSPTMAWSQSGEPALITGTAAYMAPEQARGLPVDRRADIWAFGVVLYEMLTGSRGFGGDTISDVLAAVLTRDLDLSSVPIQVRRLLRSCLERDPRQRLRDIGDVWKLLDEEPARTSRAAGSRWVWPAAAAVAALVAAGLAFLSFGASPPPTPTTRFRITLPERVAVASGTAFAVSPDGRSLAFPAIGPDGARRLWLHTLDALEPHPLEQTEIANTSIAFWSPDSRSLVYQDREGRLRKISAAGDTPETLLEKPGQVLGGSWHRDGVILVGTPAGIVRMPASGGTPVPVTRAQPDRDGRLHVAPVLLPDGRHFLYLALASRAAGGEGSAIHVGSLDAAPEAQNPRALLQTSLAPAFAPGPDGGHLLYLRPGTQTLVAQTIDVETPQLTGDAIVLAEGVGLDTNIVTGSFSVSETGVLVYRGATSPDLQLTWFDRQGRSVGPAGEPGLFGNVVLSPDDRQAAVSLYDVAARNRDIWLMTLDAPGMTRFTFDPAVEGQPVWSPDGGRVAFVSNRQPPGIYVKTSSGAGQETLLFEGDASLTDWSRDGRYLLFNRRQGDTGSDLWLLPADGGEPIPVVRFAGTQYGGRLSPDGKWVAYISDESGRNEIYVQGVTLDGSASGGKWMISKTGAAGMARWGNAGQELFFMARDGSVMSVPVTSNPVFRAGVPSPLFQMPAAFLRSNANPGAVSDAARDGSRFLLAMPRGPARDEFTVVLNWHAGIEDGQTR